MPAKGVRRRWYLDLHGIRREGTKETGFTYRFPNGEPVTDEKQLGRIARLRIPQLNVDLRIARVRSQVRIGPASTFPLGIG